MKTNGKLTYDQFLSRKSRRTDPAGFEPLWLPDYLFDFQRVLTEWSIRIGRGGLFANTGLGKSPMELVWAENVVRKTNKNVLFLTPLTVAKQMMREAEKFQVEVNDARKNKIKKGINILNYEQLHKVDPSKFAACVGDEISCIKNFDAKRRRQVTDFVHRIPYRLLASATPAPNDYMELGSYSEALQVMNRNQMLGMFFSHKGDSTQQWELKGHARKAYWRWVASWARAIRKPSDFGFDDGDFELPPLRVQKHLVEGGIYSGEGFFSEAHSLDDQRREKKQTIQERCELVTSLIPKDRSAIVWCHYNPEGDLLEKLIPNSKQVAGRHSDEEKEDTLEAFLDGSLQVLITKPKIAAFGMNWQHCGDVFCFPSHSFEQYFQLVRRCWRFGRKDPVNVNIIATEAELPIMTNMLRKERQAIELFDGIIREMNQYQLPLQKKESEKTVEMEIPAWL